MGFPTGISAWSWLRPLSIVMVHLSRFSEEIILWCSWEFKFVELDDAFSTGSSIMPQKKNPDIAELVRGKSGRVFGDLTALLTVMKGLPLAYNKDMQEDKEAIFDSVETVKMCLTAFTPMLATMKVLPENMRKAAAGGFINATDCADYLVKKGLPSGMRIKPPELWLPGALNWGKPWKLCRWRNIKRYASLLARASMTPFL